MIDRERFHVRRVDVERRSFVFVSDDRRYWDACIAADTARAELGGDWIVWDSQARCVLYDSRRLTRLQ